jgi:hypothetical protein
MLIPGQFSFALLLVQVTLVAVVIGLVRQAFVSSLPFLLIPALLVLGAVYGIFRWMMGMEDPPDFPPGPIP